MRSDVELASTSLPAQTKNRDLGMRVVTATSCDLDRILACLKREYDGDDGKGFWVNRQIIRQSPKDGDLWVIREGVNVVGFQVGNYSPNILSVRKEGQRRGFGTALFKAGLARALRGGINVLQVECSPRSSFPFWQRHGLERYGDTTESAPLKVCLVLQHRLHVLPDLPRVEVTISFRLEDGFYGERVSPIAVHTVAGRLSEDGVVLMKRRVIGLSDGERFCRDLLVRIEVDGEVCCFCKAKYPEAEKVGVMRKLQDGTFYVDAVRTASWCG